MSPFARADVEVDADEASRLLLVRRGELEVELNFADRPQDGVEPLGIRVSGRAEGVPPA